MKKEEKKVKAEDCCPFSLYRYASITFDPNQARKRNHAEEIITL
jgi:hypothetical protein